MEDLEIATSQVIPAGGYGYINSGADDLFTYQENERTFDHRLIIPHVLRDIELLDTTTHFNEEMLAAPIVMTPVAAHGLIHVKAEKVSVRGVADFGTIRTVSSHAPCTPEEIKEAGGGKASQWFQLYMSRDNGINLDILGVAKRNGAKAIVLVAGAVVGGSRETDRRDGFTLPLPVPIVQAYQPGVDQTANTVYKSSKQKLSPKDVGFIAAHSNLSAYMKDVQSKEGVYRSLEPDVDRIWVSNHGGRRLDERPATFNSLQYVVEAVDKRMSIVLDSGVRCGQHVFKAIISGVDLVAIDEPAIYGLPLEGNIGVHQVFDSFKTELEMVM